MLLVANGSVFTRNAQAPFIPNGAVAIDGDTIVEVGPECELKVKYPDAEYVDAQGNLIMPGLINCHTHIYSGLARDLAIKGCNPTNFLENLEQQWWKIDDNLTLDGTKASAYATILDSIRDGVTTIFDHHASFCEIPGSLFTIKDAAQELGMRSCLCYEVSDRRGQEKCDQAIAENAEFAQWAAKECRDNDNHMIAAMPNVGWCEAMTMLFENNAKMASKYFDRKLGVLEPGACASATPYLRPPRGLAGRYREELTMSDIMRPIPFSQLMNCIIEEHKTQDAIFGVRKMVTTNQEGALPIFDERIETPFGPAAGPNTQLAQNIVASYVAGSRFFELKTVQVMDGEELSKCVNKPCIVAQDECYNCEWSTELEVPQAFAEYVKAWFACHLIAREYGLGSPDGFVFNMSVGYDLEGIKSPKVDAYIEGMKDASGSDVWNECRTWALANLTSLSMSMPRLSSPSRRASPTPSPSPRCMAARRRRSSASRPTSSPRRASTPTSSATPRCWAMSLHVSASTSWALTISSSMTRTSARTCSGPMPCPCSSA